MAQFLPGNLNIRLLWSDVISAFDFDKSLTVETPSTIVDRVAMFQIITNRGILDNSIKDRVGEQLIPMVGKPRVQKSGLKVQIVFTWPEVRQNTNYQWKVYNNQINTDNTWILMLIRNMIWWLSLMRDKLFETRNVVKWMLFKIV